MNLRLQDGAEPTVDAGGRRPDSSYFKARLPSEGDQQLKCASEVTQWDTHSVVEDKANQSEDGVGSGNASLTSGWEPSGTSAAAGGEGKHSSAHKQALASPPCGKLEMTHRGEQPVESEVSGRSFRRKSHLLRGYDLIHKSEKPFRCVLCKRRFILESNLQRPTWKNNCRINPICVLCAKNHSVTRKSWRIISSGINENPFAGTLSGISSGTKTPNEEEHLPDQSHLCALCEKLFSDLGKLENHLNLRLLMFAKISENTYGDCRQSMHVVDRVVKYRRYLYRRYFLAILYFSIGIVSLIRFQKTIAGQTPFKCAVCGNVFTLERNLHRHEMIHTGEKPFSCEVCGRRFTQKPHLRSHEIIHTGQTPF
ncbi:unnamed protein product, partial [Cyprideis torosa]